MKRTIAAVALAGTAALSLAACGSGAAAPAGTVTVPSASIPSASSPAATATSVSNCTVDCTAPIASGANAWYAQVQAPLHEVTGDLTQISSDASGNPASLSGDGAELAQDAQAVLNEEIDPAPVDNADFAAAMNDYIAAGNDYSGDNSSGQQNTAQAIQEIGEGDTALNSFDAAIGGSSATTAPASSAPAVATSAPAAAATTPAAPATAPAAPGTATAAALWCGPVTNVRTAPSLAVWKTGSGGADDVYVNVLPQLKVGAMTIDNPATPAATVLVDSASLCSEVIEADEEPPPVDLAQYNMAMSYFLQASQVLHTGAAAYTASVATARVEVNRGVSELNAFLTVIGK